MTPLLLCLGLLGPAVTPIQLPPWYAGRHAVLVVVDGLGAQSLDDADTRKQLPALAERYLKDGQQPVRLHSLWPSSGPIEAAAVAAGEPLEIEAEGLLPPYGLEAWPEAVVTYPATTATGGLAGLLASLPGSADQGPPPVIAVAHVRAYADAVEQHGPGSKPAHQALESLDRELEQLAQRYAVLGLAARTTFAVVGPGRTVKRFRQLDAAQILAPLLPRKQRRDGRLADLLHAFSPLEVSQLGGLAFAGPRSAPTAPGAEPVPSTLQDLFRATGLPRREQRGVLDALAHDPGVALVVARERLGEGGDEELLVVGREGRARLELRGDGSVRYRLQRGRDPLGLETLPADLDPERFHAALVWRQALAAQSDPLGRVALLLELQPAAGLAVVARSGTSFDARGRSTGLDAAGVLLLAGAATPVALAPLRSRDVMPTLRALVAAPPAPPGGDEVVAEALIEATASSTLEALGRLLTTRAIGAFSSRRAHDSSVIDTTELRRFGRSPRYFGKLAAALAEDDPLSYLPEPSLRRQIGPRRSLLFATTRLSGRIEKLVLDQQPAAIRRFDPLIRPQLMLTGFLADPKVRSQLRILEGPRQRTRARARTAPAAP